MRVGVTLPQFRPSPEPALDAARAAEAAGLDGVFVFDHVWAIGQPDRPAQSAWPLLGALAAETARVAVGTLVARVGLLPPEVLLGNLESLHRMLGPRLVAGLGTGDRLSEAENRAVDVPFPPAAERLAALAEACAATRALGITTWVGGLSARVAELARAGADALNLWAVDPERVAAEVARGGVEVTWGGVLPPDPGAAADLLARLRAAGATWAVCAPPYGAAPDPTPAVGMVAGARAALR
ncbi:MAG TPA: LLM class flavin-dependent oxidoreductase [Acidimicrobiales bacterium]|nr:LLM class flavin-dependent oxidoreductase [Acidimicrobiales bacterium]